MALVDRNFNVELRPLGNNDQVLIADSTQPNGVRWKTLYAADFLPNFEFSFLTPSPSAVLVGQTIASGDLKFTWGANQDISENNRLTNGINTITLPSSTITGYWPYDLVQNTVNASFSFSLTASGLENSGYDSITNAVTWLQKAYYGATGIATYDSGFIHSLQNSEFTPNGNLTFSATASTNFYLFYSFRTDAGTPQFIDLISNIAGGFSLVSSSISFANGSGYTEDYQLWKSNQPALGLREIQVIF